MSDLPEDVRIVYISPLGVETEITRNVLFADAYFELQAAAVPGSFHLTVKDVDRNQEFVSGGRVELYLGTGGQYWRKMFGGFVSVPTRDFFFSALDTSKPVTGRRWSLDGVDYNYLLDKRVLRNPANYIGLIPKIPVGTNGNDQHVISRFSSYFDLGFSGGGSINVIDKVQLVNDFDETFVWPTQGETMRSVLDAIVIDTTRIGLYACIYWLSPSEGANGADLNWLAIQDTQAPWGFSDIPDGTNYIGWRDGTASEDGGSVINEDFIWGGSPFTGSGAVVLGHASNTDSISAHGRWQLAENHPGDELYKSQKQVNARAKALISGTTSGTSPVTGAQGLVNPDLQYTLTWFAHDVPISLGRLHLIPGMVTNFKLWSFSQDGGLTPYSPVPGVEGVNVPLRQVKITFPTLPGDNPNADPLTFVQFEGTFGLQMSDPVWWWQYMRNMRPKPQPAPVIVADGTSPATPPYGSYYTFAPKESPDGVRTVFSLVPNYMPGSLQVSLNGLVQSKGTSFTETDPAADGGGTFTFAVAPLAGDVILCDCRTTGTGAVRDTSIVGFGALATGGSGYADVHVTTLEPTGLRVAHGRPVGQQPEHHLRRERDHRPRTPASRHQREEQLHP